MLAPMTDAAKNALPPLVVNVADAEEHEHYDGEHWGHAYKILTPGMRPRGALLGVNQTRLPPGRAAGPFHSHMLEDEVFFVLSGRGILRYGDQLSEIGPGDCISCPAGAEVAHQIANPYDTDLVYLAIGNHEPNEVAFFPDTGKVSIRSKKKIGRFQPTDYMAGEPDRPRIFELHDDRE